VVEDGIIGTDGGLGVAAGSLDWIKPPGDGAGDFISAGRVGSGGELERPNTLIPPERNTRLKHNMGAYSAAFAEHDAIDEATVV